MQQVLFDGIPVPRVPPFTKQLLKWVGNKQRFAHEIVAYFPPRFGTYYEPFLGSGGVLGTLAPPRAVGSDCFKPLMEIWTTLRNDPEQLKRWYAERHALAIKMGKEPAFEQVRAAYNAAPNGADLLYLCRTCYGGVVRFRKADGYCSTPCGIHAAIPPEKFAQRVDAWRRRTAGAVFQRADYGTIMRQAGPGDLIYCDPPYSHSQAILYGAQSFCLGDLFGEIDRCKSRGAFVALSIDGSKKTGAHQCPISLPAGLFEREILVNCGRSMLRRFQRSGESLEDEVVHDRLLLTY